MNETTTYVDPDEIPDDHILPQEEWDAIVERANEIYDERYSVAGGGADDFTPMGITPVYKQFDTGPYDKSSTLTRPQLYVIHTGETPLRVGYASSLTEWADGDSYSPRVSWHRFVDPATVALFIRLGRAAWHAAGGNSLSYVGYEQSGYASYTREQWLSPDGRRQLDLLSQQIVKDGLDTAAEIKRLPDAQVSAVLNGTDHTTRGLCSHEQISRLTGRNSRTDPGKGYPWDYLLEGVLHYAGLGEPPVDPPPVPSTDLVIDGQFGPATARRRQRMLGTQVDGIVSNQTYSIRDANPGLAARGNWRFNDTRDGSSMVRADQYRLKKKGLYTLTVDGLAGPGYWSALSKENGMSWDGNIDEPDNLVKRLQANMNAGKL